MWYPRPWILAACLIKCIATELTARPSSSPAGGACSRVLSREATDITEDILMAAYSSGVPMSQLCPLSPQRNRYGAQEKLKREIRHNLWQCNACNKQFRAERWLDGHLDRSHTHLIDASIDSVCPADYCSILGCPGLKGVSREEEEEGFAEDNEESDTEQFAGSVVQYRSEGEQEIEVASRSNSPVSLPRVDKALASSAEAVDDPTSRSSRRRHGGLGHAQSEAQPSFQYKAQVTHEHRPALHRDAQAARGSGLSKKQVRERERCAAILLSCFPLPVEQKDLSTKEAHRNMEIRGQGQDAAVPDDALTGDPKRRLRRTHSLTTHESLLALRHNILTQYCDAKLEDKADRARAKKEGLSPSIILWGAIVAVFLVTAGLAWLTSWTENAAAEKLARRQQAKKQKSGGLGPGLAPVAQLATLSDVTRTEDSVPVARVANGHSRAVRALADSLRPRGR